MITSNETKGVTIYPEGRMLRGDGTTRPRRRTADGAPPDRPARGTLRDYYFLWVVM
jgi:hypothetical protein